MTKEQRKYLSDQILKTFERERRALEEQRTPPPSLNNYLVAAFLDNTIKFADMEALKEQIRARVKKMGAGAVLIHEPRGKSRWHDDDEERNAEEMHIEIPAVELFEIPAAYSEAYRKWDENRIRINAALEALTSQKDTLLLKIQIGSNTMLENFVKEVDDLGALTLNDSQMLLNGVGKKNQQNLIDQAEKVLKQLKSS